MYPVSGDGHLGRLAAMFRKTKSTKSLSFVQ